MIVFVACLLILTQSEALDDNIAVDKSCPQDAVQLVTSKYFSVYNDTCFLFMVYDQVLFETAQTKCRSNGGILAMPKTKDINDFLLQEMEHLQHNKPVWIGMHDKETEGKWIWDDGSEVVPWGNMNLFNGGFFGGGEDCMALDPRDKDWHDYRCSVTGFAARVGLFANQRLSFICQYNIQKDAASSDDQNDD